MQELEQIKKIVKETMSKYFDDISIFKIEIKEDVDADGDKVLRINIVFDGSSKDLDLKKLTGTARRLRPKLDEIHESALPLLSFISKADYEARAC